MKIKIDHREKDFIQIAEQCFANSSFPGIEMEVCNLPLGDVILTDHQGSEKIILERKTLTDLAASIKDGRYEEQSYRLQGINHPNHNILYIIEGDMNKMIMFKHKVDKSVLYSAMFSLNYYKGFSIFRTQNIEETVHFVFHIANKLNKGIAENRKPYYLVPNPSPSQPSTALGSKDTESNGIQEEKEYCGLVKRVKKDNITINNIGEIMLCQIPGVSSATAMAVFQQFKNMASLISALKENPECLQDLSYTNSKGQTRKISKTAIENIKKFMQTSE